MWNESVFFLTCASDAFIFLFHTLFSQILRQEGEKSRVICGVREESASYWCDGDNAWCPVPASDRLISGRSLPEIGWLHSSQVIIICNQRRVSTHTDEYALHYDLSHELFII